VPHSPKRKTRIDLPDPSSARPQPPHGSVSDQQIREADGLVLIDPDRPDWQQVLWTAEIGSDKSSSLNMKIVEIPVDSQDDGEIEAVRRRVAQLKASGESL